MECITSYYLKSSSYLKQKRLAIHLIHLWPLNQLPPLALWTVIQKTSFRRVDFLNLGFGKVLQRLWICCGHCSENNTYVVSSSNMICRIECKWWNTKTWQIFERSNMVTKEKKNLQTVRGCIFLPLIFGIWVVCACFRRWRGLCKLAKFVCFFYYYTDCSLSSLDLSFFCFSM